ncbi:hypothetical protein DCS_05429 [Drechmeria coniospora]|uniref:Chorismate synthase protein n=1 Tax=Drechmeria coniospora TaxID=98403 RepID=A0A151GMR3_DRECN|nr:hypothetical protein DCS_05429 [Drechmeria coniospora]KYK58414.1 hypothetical protein DCS_05429 [Drechmeria coniospora]ODA83780.1 hypothetical protein RJ55_02296 [Drechmeria coniospora]
MAIPWSSIRSLLLFFGPVLLPKAIIYYRSVRDTSRRRNLPIRPVPRGVLVPLALLVVLVLAFLAASLPPFSPENVFARTQSRLQIPNDVLFNRLAALRPSRTLTRTDEALRARFVNLESRLLYLQFGPDVLADCPFCNVDEPMSFYYYALTSMLWPHLINLVVIAVATSPSWTGKSGSQWRTFATITAAVVAAGEVYVVSAYNYQANARALRLADVDFFFWDVRVYRLVALAAFDASLAWVLYLSSTNRAFGQPLSPAERVEAVSQGLAAVKSKMHAVGIIKNTAQRDEDLRLRSQAYWMHEVRLMGEVMEEREVIEGVNDALSNRINIESISKEADVYSHGVLQHLRQEETASGAAG